MCVYVCVDIMCIYAFSTVAILFQERLNELVSRQLSVCVLAQLCILALQLCVCVPAVQCGWAQTDCALPSVSLWQGVFHPGSGSDAGLHKTLV